MEIKLTTTQLKKTADSLLAVAQAVLVTTLVGGFVPGVNSKIGIGAFIAGLIVSIGFYVLAMWLLKEV